MSKKNNVSAASRRSLKISRGACSAAAVPSAPDSRCAARSSACARKPTRRSALNSFSQAALEVTTTSHASGAAVAHANLALRDFTRIVVATQSAIAASIWFAIPNSGQRLLIPPSGSIVPKYRK